MNLKRFILPFIRKKVDQPTLTKSDPERFLRRLTRQLLKAYTEPSRLI